MGHYVFSPQKMHQNSAWISQRIVNILKRVEIFRSSLLLVKIHNIPFLYRRRGRIRVQWKLHSCKRGRSCLDRDWIEWQRKNLENNGSRLDVDFVPNSDRQGRCSRDYFCPLLEQNTWHDNRRWLKWLWVQRSQQVKWEGQVGNDVKMHWPC